MSVAAKIALSTVLVVAFTMLETALSFAVRDYHQVNVRRLYDREWTERIMNGGARRCEK